MRRTLIGTFALVAALSEAAWASGPYQTDDAGLTTLGTAQVEGWLRTGPAGWESWVIPAMQVVPNLEVALGIGTTGSTDSLEEDFVVQGKTLFRPLITNDWGIGFAAGATLGAAGRPAGGPSGSFYAYVPVSWSVWDDRLVLHHNLGYLFDPGSMRPHDWSWNFAAEGELFESRWGAAAEVYGDTRSMPFYQAGIRWWLAPELTRMDLTVNGQVHGSAQLSLGISLYGVVQESPKLHSERPTRTEGPSQAQEGPGEQGGG